MHEPRLPSTPVENPTIGPRTRYFDDLVVEATGAGIRQVILVAAGMDTRAFRLMCRRIVAPADLEEAGWPDLLVASGFDRSRPAVFVAKDSPIT